MDLARKNTIANILLLLLLLLSFFLQDTVKSNILQFNVIIPIRTVYTLLEEKNSLHLLSDPEAVELVCKQQATSISTQNDLELEPDNYYSNMLVDCGHA